MQTVVKPYMVMDIYSKSSTLLSSPQFALQWFICIHKMGVCMGLQLMQTS